MRYYKKRERFEKYMAARAAGNLDGLLTPEQAVEAYYEFMKLWTDFTLLQKIRYARQRQEEHRAYSNKRHIPVHDHKGSTRTDEQYWEVAYENAQRRTYDGAEGR